MKPEYADALSGSVLLHRRAAGTGSLIAVESVLWVLFPADSFLESTVHR